MTILLDGVANVEGAFCFDVSRPATLSKGDSIHNIVAFIVDQFEFNVFLAAAYYLARAVVVDVFCAEERFRVVWSEGREAPQLLIETKIDVFKV